MASIRVSELTATATAAADSFLYLADTTNGGVEFDSKKITVANFLNAYATETFVNTAIENLINGAPEALDTLKEISDAIGDSGDIVGNLIGMINANETHMDNMASLSGVAKDSTDLGTFTGTTIGDASSIRAALQALETSLETKGASSSLNSNISNTNDLVSLSGLAAGSVNMGLFDGDTLSDNATLKVVLQSAETAIEANASAISQEVSDRAAAVTALTNGAVASNTSAIAQEVSDRAAAVTALTNGAVATNANGVSTNAAAITALTNGAVASNTSAIAQEVTDRQAAVSAEATARADADALLMPKAGGTFTGPISGPAPTSDLHLATKKYADDLVANVDLSQVETNRLNIIAEGNARSSADTSLSNRLDVLEADPTTQTLLTAETTARTSADSALSGRLDVLEADPTTGTALSSEATTRAAADSALSGRLDTLEADPTTQTLLDAETAARIAGDALKLDLAGGTMTGAVSFGQGAAATPTISLANSSSGSENVNGLEAAYPTSGGSGWQTYTADVSKERASGGVHYFEVLMGGGGWSSTRGFFGITGTETNAELVFGSSGVEPINSDPANKSTNIYNRTDYNNPDFDNGDVLGIRLDIDNDRIYYTVNGVAEDDEAINTTATHYRPAVTLFQSGITFRFAAEDMEYMPAGASAWASGGGAATVVAVDGTATFGGNVTASAVPTADAHLVNKLYADNLVAGVDLSGIATNAAAIQALTNGAPELLNTLSELADAINDDENFATTVTQQITNEASTRSSADTALSGRLDVLEADPTTATAVSNEASARASADTALSNRLDTLEADPTTATALATETSDRISGDASLSTAITSLTNGAVASNTSAIAAETTARTNADSVLSGRLDTLEADPTTATALSSAVTTLNNSIAAEETARIAADALLMPKSGGTFTGAISGPVPTADSHLATKKFAEDLVAGIDLSQIETNRLAIIQEISDRAAAITALTNGAVATNASNISANTTAISQEVTDRAAAITALTNGQVATNTSGIATNAAAITNLTNGAVADNAAAITALTNGAVATNTAATAQEVTDRQAAITALTNGAVADNAAAITALANGAVADNAAAIAQETTDRIAADALKVDKQSTVNEHMLGQTSAQSAPVDAQGNSNYLFLVVDKATGALKSIDKTFLEAE